MMYEDLRAIKQACQELGIVERGQIEAISMICGGLIRRFK